MATKISKCLPKMADISETVRLVLKRTEKFGPTGLLYCIIKFILKKLKKCRNDSKKIKCLISQIIIWG